MSGCVNLISAVRSYALGEATWRATCYGTPNRPRLRQRNPSIRPRCPGWWWAAARGAA
jgi:hypothetical protein